jgi:hypothetical protein
MLSALSLPPVTRCLLEDVCLRGALPAHDLPAPADIVREAERQMIGGWLAQVAETHPEGAWAGAVRQGLADHLKLNALHTLALIKETLGAVKLLESRGIDVLVLKGPFLSRRYYGDYAIRHAGDVDLLVEEKDIEQADAVLRNAGYRRRKPLELLRGRRLLLYLNTQHEFGYESRDGAMGVELHWRFADCRQLSHFRFADLRNRGEAMQVGADSVRVLSPADTFLQLAIHGATDGWSRLKWIADLPRVYAALTPADRQSLLIPAPKSTSLRIVELALFLCGQISETGVREQLLRAFDYIQQRLLQADTTRAGPGLQLRKFAAHYRYLFELCDEQGWAPLLYANLIMPRDFDALPLPDRMTALLPFVAQLRRVAFRMSGNA